MKIRPFFGGILAAIGWIIVTLTGPCAVIMLTQGTNDIFILPALFGAALISVGRWVTQGNVEIPVEKFEEWNDVKEAGPQEPEPNAGLGIIILGIIISVPSLVFLYGVFTAQRLHTGPLISGTVLGCCFLALGIKMVSDGWKRWVKRAKDGDSGEGQ